MIYSDLTYIKTSPAAGDYLVGADFALSGKNYKMTYGNHASWIFGLSGTLINKTINAANNSISGLTNSNIAAGAAIDASKIANGSVSNTEFQYIANLTSDAQTQLNGKAATSHTHNANQIGNGDVDNTELSYLNGANESIVNAFKAFRNKGFGVVTLPTYSNPSAGVLRVNFDGVYVFNGSADGTSDNIKVTTCSQAGTYLDISGIPDLSVAYVYAAYNLDSGDPKYSIAWTNNPMLFENDATKNYIFRATRDGNGFHILNYDSYAVALPEKLLFKEIALRGFERISGLVLS